jgi:hypothetical protein
VNVTRSPVTRPHGEIPRSGDARDLARVLTFSTAPTRSPTTSLARRRRDHLVANAVDEYHAHIRAVAKNVALGHHQIRDLSSLDAAQLRADARDFGSPHRERLERDVARQPRGDRFANVAEEFARA